MDTHATALTVHVPAAAGGDREAFARLVDATRSLVSSIALAIVRDADLSRDIAQDVFVAAWRDLGHLREAESFLPWLRQLTRHRAYHVLRTERRRARRVTYGDQSSLTEAARDPAPSVDARLLAEEELRLLDAVLSELPDEVREVVTLYYLEGESTAHVARLLGLSEAAVRQRLSRARKRLRASLLDRFGAVAARTTPDGTFTAAVVTALAVGAPTAASASTLTAASVAGPSLLGKIAALGAGAALGAAGGIAGVVFGTRQLKRQARTADEFLALGRFERASIVLVVLAATAYPLGWHLTHSPAAPVATFVAFLAGLMALHFLWLPRIVGARHEAEALEDPVAAADARAAERRVAILGWTLGLLSGGLGLLAGLGMVGAGHWF